MFLGDSWCWDSGPKVLNWRKSQWASQTMHHVVVPIENEHCPLKSLCTRSWREEEQGVGLSSTNCVLRKSRCLLNKALQSRRWSVVTAVRNWSLRCCNRMKRPWATVVACDRPVQGQSVTDSVYTMTARSKQLRGIALNTHKETIHAIDASRPQAVFRSLNFKHKKLGLCFKLKRISHYVIQCYSLQQ